MPSKIRLKQIEEFELSEFILSVNTGISGSLNSEITGLSGYFDNRLSNTITYLESGINLNSGVEDQFVSFPANFTSTPKIIGTMSSNNSGIIPYHISGESTSGFYLHLSDNTPDNSYNFNFTATTGQGFYMIFHES